METMANQRKAGISPLDEEMKKSDDRLPIFMSLHDFHLAPPCTGSGAGACLFFYVNNDDRIAAKARMPLFIWQGGLGLPDRDYYFNTDARQHQYPEREYVGTMFQKMFQVVLVHDHGSKQMPPLRSLWRWRRITRRSASRNA
jgi:putative endopeptidase